MNDQLSIIFQDESQLIDFCLWFKNEGFEVFMRSKFNGQNSNEISCMETDEFPKHDDAEFYDGQPLFELA